MVTNVDDKIRLMLVDDHFVVRMGLASSLEMEEDIHIAAEAGTAADAIFLYKDCKPQVVVLDYQLPDGTGIDVIEEIVKFDRSAKILVFTVFDGEEDIFRAVEAGAKGFLIKTADRSELLKAIRTVSTGGEYLTDSVGKMLEERRQRPSLSRRQSEVLHLIAKGASNGQIAGKLGIAEVTVKLHVTQILQKLKVDDRTQAALAAIQRGIVHLD
ncbi:response regulator [Stratiformator vulcanicus]|nr:response regulator transcription factor [Stratiformator vulcanicus]